MRIEILVGLENPVFYPINSSKTIIGNDLSCDIVISEDQISRKHLIIVQEGDTYYVIDQGSTNGSYLNEERLIPGRRVEFTSYFPVRLGSSVLVSLVSDEEAMDEVNSLSIPFPTESSAPKKNPLASVPKSREPDERTTVISLRDLQTSSTGTMVKRREAYKKKVAARAKEEADPKKKKKKGKKKKKKFLEFYEIVALGIIGVALYLTFTGEKEGPVSLSTEVATDKTPGPQTETPMMPKLKKVTTPNFLELFELKSVKKCQSEEEKILCESIELGEGDKWGAVTYGGQLVVLVDATKYYEYIVQKLPPPKDYDPNTQEGEKAYNQERWELTIGWFLAIGFKSDDYLKLEGKEIVFAFFLASGEIYSTQASFGVRPKGLSELRRLTDKNRFNYIEVSRAQILNYFADYIEVNL